MSQEGAPGVGELHAPVMRRLRDAGRDPKAFGGSHVRLWSVAAFGALVVTTLLPFLWPDSLPWLQRTTPILSLFFLLAAGAVWLGMDRRAFPVAAAMVVALYFSTGWTWFIWDLHDFYVVALLSSFAVFALAGFNLVFILEEMVFDLHRHLPLFHRPWSFMPSLGITAVAVGLPFLTMLTGFRLPAMWVTSMLAAATLWGWWILRAFNPIREGPVLRELHMLAAASITAAGIADLASAFQEQTGIVPSLVAYAVLIGTWLYVSYTTLQRTHFLLASKNVRPWILILLSASFALLNHAQLQFSAGGTGAVTALLSQRTLYLVAGIWVGMAFYVVQAVWRVLRDIRDDRRMAPGDRVMAGRLARIFEALFMAERRLETAAGQVYRGVDHYLLGHVERTDLPHGASGVVASWSLDAERGLLADDEE